MGKAIPLILIALLVVISGSSIYEYNQNQRLAAENMRLRGENYVQHEQLINQANEIAHLQRKTWIAVPIAFVWNTNLDVDEDQLKAAIDSLSQHWAHMQIYFIIIGMGPHEFMPIDDNCQIWDLNWIPKAIALYSQHHITVGVFRSVFQGGAGAGGGCARPNYAEVSISGCACGILFFNNYVKGCVTTMAFYDVLSHETLHCMSFTDDELHAHPEMIRGDIPTQWRERLVTAAETFNLPSSDPLRG